MYNGQLDEEKGDSVTSKTSNQRLSPENLRVNGNGKHSASSDLKSGGNGNGLNVSLLNDRKLNSGSQHGSSSSSSDSSDPNRAILDNNYINSLKKQINGCINVLNPYLPSKLTLLKISAGGSVAIEPLFAYFIYAPILKGLQELIMLMGASKGTAHAIALVGAPVFASLNLISDVLAILPVIEAYQAMTPDTPEQKAKKEAELSMLTDEQKEILKIYINCNVALANVVQFVPGGIADSIFFVDKIPVLPLALIPTAAVTFLAIVYYNIFGLGALTKHSKALLFDLVEFLPVMAKDPILAIELCIRACFNAINRGTSFAYITYAFCVSFLGMEPSNPILQTTTGIMFILNTYVTLISRTLPTKEGIFRTPEEREKTAELRQLARISADLEKMESMLQLTPEQVANNLALKAELVALAAKVKTAETATYFDTFANMALASVTRGVPLAYLLYTRMGLSWELSSALGGVMLALNFVARQRIDVNSKMSKLDNPFEYTVQFMLADEALPNAVSTAKDKTVYVKINGGGQLSLVYAMKNGDVFGGGDHLLMSENANFNEIPEKFILGYVFCKNNDKIELFYYNKAKNDGIPLKLELKQELVESEQQFNFDVFLRKIFEKSLEKPKIIQLSDEDFKNITLFTGHTLLENGVVLINNNNVTLVSSVSKIQNQISLSEQESTALMNVLIDHAKQMRYIPYASKLNLVINKTLDAQEKEMKKYQEKVEAYKNDSIINMFANIPSDGGRLSRLVLAMGSMYILVNKVFKLGFSSAEILCLTLLISTITAEAERRMWKKDYIVPTIANHLATKDLVREDQPAIVCSDLKDCSKLGQLAAQFGTFMSKAPEEIIAARFEGGNAVRDDGSDHSSERGDGDMHMRRIVENEISNSFA